MMPNQLLGMLQQLKANPMQFLAQQRINLPQGVNDPQVILNHLLQTGQISQQQKNHCEQGILVCTSADQLLSLVIMTAEFFFLEFVYYYIGDQSETYSERQPCCI